MGGLRAELAQKVKGGGFERGKRCDEGRGIWLFLGRDPAKAIVS